MPPVKPIFNQFGKTVGWISNGTIFDHRNSYRAFVSGEGVFNYRGQHLGWLEAGFFRDKQGHAVAFLEGATGGPATPVTASPPPPPITQIPPHFPSPSAP